MPSSNRPKCPNIFWTVASSNRSVLYSNDPCRPPGVSKKLTVKSNFAVACSVSRELNVDIGQRQLAGLRMLQNEHDLKERCSAEISRNLELLDQLLERQILMRIRCQCRLADLREQFIKAQVAVHIGSHHQGVGKEADQPLDLFSRAAGY